MPNSNRQPAISTFIWKVSFVVGIASFTPYSALAADSGISQAEYARLVKVAKKEQFDAQLTSKLSELALSKAPDLPVSREPFDEEETWSSIKEREHRYVPQLQRVLEGYSGGRQSNLSNVINWLIGMAGEIKLKTETLELCINYFMRFQEIREVPFNCLRKLALSALVIAGRYEEAQPPVISELLDHSDQICTKNDAIIVMLDIHDTLSMNYSVITPGHVLNALLEQLPANPHLYELCFYLLHEGYVNLVAFSHAPTQIAVAVLLTALRIEDSSAQLPAPLHPFLIYIAEWEGSFSPQSWAAYEKKHLKILLARMALAWEKRGSQVYTWARELYSTPEHLMVAN